MAKGARRESLEEIADRHLAACRLFMEKAFEAMRRVGPEKVLAATRLEARTWKQRLLSKRVPR